MILIKIKIEMANKQYKYRDAVTGKYVTSTFAKKNPNTTVKETDKSKSNKK